MSRLRVQIFRQREDLRIARHKHRHCLRCTFPLRCVTFTSAKICVQCRVRYHDNVLRHSPTYNEGAHDGNRGGCSLDWSGWHVGSMVPSFSVTLEVWFRAAERQIVKQIVDIPVCAERQFVEQIVDISVSQFHSSCPFKLAKSSWWIDSPFPMVTL